MSYYVEPDHAEWARLWNSLHALMGDCDELNHANGERWQYMGSAQEAGGQWVHQFRHRDRPRPTGNVDLMTGGPRILTRYYLPTGRVYLNLFASPEFCTQRARIDAKPQHCQDA